nr:SGNH/GDSL hydrolase family protein [Leptolyngbya sp. UWPOB_LEPTO1]
MGQAWAILGLTLALLLLVDHLLRAFLPDPLAATPFEAGAVAPARERAAAVAGDDWIGRYWAEHAQARDTAWRSYVYWRRQPHQGEIINVDAHGFRVTPRPAEPPEREIWLFGGSVAWGTGNRDTGTLAAQLQQVYAERAPELRVRVLNFGESGYVSRQSLAAFQSALACSQPAADLAVFLDGANDVFATLQSRQAGWPQNEDNRRREFNSSRRFGAQLRAWAMQLEGIGRLLASAPEALDGAAILRLAADTAAAWAANVRQAQAIGAAFDVPVMPLWQPTAFDRSPPRGDEAGVRSCVLAQPASSARASAPDSGRTRRERARGRMSVFTGEVVADLQQQADEGVLFGVGQAFEGAGPDPDAALVDVRPHRPPRVGEADQQRAAVGRIGDADGEAAFFQPIEEPGHGARVQLGLARQFRRAGFAVGEPLERDELAEGEVVAGRGQLAFHPGPHCIADLPEQEPELGAGFGRG